MAYGEQDVLERSLQDIDEIRKLRNRYPVIWVDVEGLGDASVVATLGDVFGLHALALEDVLNTHQRAKVDEYGDHLFIIARMVRVTDRLGERSRCGQGSTVGQEGTVGSLGGRQGPDGKSEGGDAPER